MSVPLPQFPAKADGALPRQGTRPIGRWFQAGLFAALSMLFGVSTQAAVQGTAGPQSTGSIDINLITGLGVRIAGFADMPLGQWSGSGDLTANDNLCVGRTGVRLFGTGLYRIRASGDGEPGNPAAFTLTDGLRFIYYDAFFNDSAGTAGRQQLTPGVQLTGQTGFGFWQVLNYLNGCVVNNANISIVVPEDELRGKGGFYSGTLTLTLIPE